MNASPLDMYSAAALAEVSSLFPPANDRLPFDDDDRNAEYLDQLGDALDADLDAIEAPGLTADAAHVQSAIAVAVEAKRAAEDVAAPWNARVSRARAWLAGACQGGARWSTAAGSAYVAADSERVSYDAKALDILCNDDPALAARLWPHRKVTTTRGGLTIKGGAA